MLFHYEKSEVTKNVAVGTVKKLARNDLRNPQWINKLIHCCPATAGLTLKGKGYSDEEIEQFYANYLK